MNPIFDNGQERAAVRGHSVMTPVAHDHCWSNTHGAGYKDGKYKGNRGWNRLNGGGEQRDQREGDNYNYTEQRDMDFRHEINT